MSDPNYPSGAIEVRTGLEHVAHVAIHANLMEEVVALKDPVVLHHPQVLFANERLQDCCSDVGMIKTPGLAPCRWRSA